LRKLSDKRWIIGTTVAQDVKPSKIVYTLTNEGRTGLDAWVLGPSRTLEGIDDLLVKLYKPEPGQCGPFGQQT
jgi:DNA-binding PadR family transcriptional regulator